MRPQAHFIIDFDSTLVRVEALDVLADIIARAEPERAAELASIGDITERAMAGELDFTQALDERLRLLRPTRDQLALLTDALAEEIAPSALACQAFFSSPSVHVLSGGFREWVEPVVQRLGIGAERVMANTLLFDGAGRVCGFDRDNPVSRSGGKPVAVAGLGLAGEVVAVGDGWTDYEIRAAGAADRFYAFTEHVERPRVVAHADRVARSFDDLLRQEGIIS